MSHRKMSSCLSQWTAKSIRAFMPVGTALTSRVWNIRGKGKVLKLIYAAELLIFLILKWTQSVVCREGGLSLTFEQMFMSLSSCEIINWIWVL